MADMRPMELVAVCARCDETVTLRRMVSPQLLALGDLRAVRAIVLADHVCALA